MSHLGISCNVSSGRLRVRGVTINETGAAADVFSHSSHRGDDVPLQLRTLSTDLETRIQDLRIDRVVVRTGDFHAARGLQAATMLRLRAEGVLLAVLRSRFEAVEVLSGREIGQALGRSKDDVEAEARELLPDAVEATSAALAARRHQQ